MTTGRPSDYSPAVLKKAKAYLEACKDNYVSLKIKGQKYSTRERLIVKLPSVAGLAIHLKVARSTIYEWSAKHKEFSDILEQILAEQEQRLMEMGLSGEYNAHIAKLALGKHGYKDEKDVTSGGKPIGSILDELDDEDDDTENGSAPTKG